jgi:hypothetical protein
MTPSSRILATQLITGVVIWAHGSRWGEGQKEGKEAAGRVRGSRAAGRTGLMDERCRWERVHAHMPVCCTEQAASGPLHLAPNKRPTIQGTCSIVYGCPEAIQAAPMILFHPAAPQNQRRAPRPPLTAAGTPAPPPPPPPPP